MLDRGIIDDHIMGPRSLLGNGELRAQPRLGRLARQTARLDHSPNLFFGGGTDADNYIIIGIPIALKK